MNSFEGIQELVAVAETQGFSAAARVLGVSTSHVSRRISALEERLGTALVARTTRTVRLTDAGHVFYERCLDLLNDLDEANRLVSGQQAELRGTLRVSSAGEFAEQHLTPALIDFAGMHPKLSVEMDFNARFVNIVEEGIDFAVRYGKLTGAHSLLTARKLIDRNMLAAASPQYLAENGEPKHPNDLRHHHCLITNSDQWRFDDNGARVEVRVGGRWRANSGRCIVAACRAGLGIAYMPQSSYGDALKDGSLVPVLAPYCTARNTTWLVYSNQKHLPLRARLAIQFLLDRFKDWDEG
ncbi:MAG: LysR family transcriptional regulator [Acidobacteriota bacterium]|nr:LysR family transcriptional regulator [Acidobacteriota bacterium]